MEYQGVDTETGARLFHQKTNMGTNNIGEFLALVKALAFTQEQGVSLPIYTDSRTAMSWVRDQKVKTTLVKDHSTQEVWTWIDQAITWLKENTYPNPILKWETEKWGEIPADFGRK